MATARGCRVVGGRPRCGRGPGTAAAGIALERAGRRARRFAVRRLRRQRQDPPSERVPRRPVPGAHGAGRRDPRRRPRAPRRLRGILLRQLRRARRVHRRVRRHGGTGAAPARPGDRRHRPRRTAATRGLERRPRRPATRPLPGLAPPEHLRVGRHAGAAGRFLFRRGVGDWAAQDARDIARSTNSIISIGYDDYISFHGSIKAGLEWRP
jgi:hypothetical protein